MKREPAMNKRTVVRTMLVVAATALIATSSAWAGDNANAKEAEAMVKKGVAYLKANGADKTYAEITGKSSQFVDRDLYLTVYRTDGTVMAHGANDKMVGKQLIGLKDIDG